jgi:serine/threonine-protein kinase
MELRPGVMVTPSLRLVELLGEGGMGSVWIADHLGLETQVAVKFICTDLVKREPHLVSRFKQEALATAKIDSVHVVRVFDHGLTEDGTPYIVMELLKGSSLADWLDLSRKLSPRETRLLVTQVARLLGRAHSLGIIHRDIKPANLFLVDGDYDMFVKVLDFGVAKRQKKAGESVVTVDGAMVGTIEYMSPEQISAAKHVDGAADLWSLAVVAYECLTGQLPFLGDSVFNICSAIMGGKPIPPSRHNPDLPPEIDAWFAHALDPKLDNRYATADEFVSTFAMALGEDPASDQLTATGAFRAVHISGLDPREVAPTTPSERKGPSNSDRVQTATEPPSGPVSDEGSTLPFKGPPVPRRSERNTMAAASASLSLPDERPTDRKQTLAIAGAVLGLLAIGAVLVLSRRGDSSAAAPSASAVSSSVPSAARSSAVPSASALVSLRESMIEVPAGEYFVGCKAGSNKGCFDDEKPGHTVKLARFGLMRHEVTVKLYEACAANNKCAAAKKGDPCTFGSGKQEHPINCVTWQEAHAFCAAHGVRLPTEEEWEAAARGRESPDYPWGNDAPSCERTVMASTSAGCGTGGLLPIGSGRTDRSWIGVTDLGGSVREWTSSEYAAYPGGRAEDARGKVNRGGSWMMKVGELNTSHTRGVDSPDEVRPDIGFRCAMDL